MSDHSTEVQHAIASVAATVTELAGPWGLAPGDVRLSLEVDECEAFLVARFDEHEIAVVGFETPRGFGRAAQDRVIATCREAIEHEATQQVVQTIMRSVRRHLRLVEDADLAAA